ncbi:hypothetical protein [Ruminococcus sp.]|uniref:hypothetical protein n=1 Tax=Ruminococcus sp. TaxID=41978 RepID=UPI003F104701
MKLFIYELKKVLNKKIFLVVLAICLVINGFLLYSSQNTEENDLRLTYSDEYGEMLDEYSSMPLDKAKKQIENELLAYEISGRLESLAQADNEELIESYTLELEEYRKSNPEAYKKAVEMSESGEESFWKNSFLYDISQQIEYINSYPDFISEMYDRAKAQSASSIFGDENSFSYKNLYKTADDYSGLKDTKLSLVNSDSLTATVKYGLTDIFVIAVVLLICIYLFGYERDKGLYSLIRCTKFGRLKTIIAKVAVLFVLSAFVSVLFISSDFTVNTFLYGSTDLSVNVQSISEFRNCTLSVTTGQFLMLFALAKIIGIFVISSLLALVFICFSSSAAMYLTGLGAVGAEYLLYSLIGQNSFLNLLKYINIFYILDGGEFFGSYLNLNIFSNAVTSVPIVFAVFSAVFILCTVFSCVVFCKRNQQKKANIFSKLFEKIKSRFFRINGSTSVLKGEFFKFTVQNRMAVVLILLVLFAVVSSFGTVRYPYSEVSDADYKAYMEYLEGDITSEKENYIAEQQEYFDGLRQRLDEIAVNSELSESTKQAMSKSIENILNSKGVAFERVCEQYSRLLELKESGVNARFIDENIYSTFVSSKTREWNDFALLCLVLIIAVPCVFSVEYKNGMINLIRPTRNGKTRLFIRKIAVLLLFTLLSFIAVYLPYLIRFVSTYGTNSFATPIVCIFENLQGSAFSVMGAMIVNLLCSLLLALAVVSIITALSIITESNMFTMVLSTVLIIIPCLAVYSTESVRIGYCIANKFVAALVVVCVICVAISVIMTVISQLKFTKSRIRRKKNADS